MTVPLVFGTVGTDHHPYDRLLAWLASWPAGRDGRARVVVQSGTAAPVAGLDCRPSLDVSTLHDLIDEAVAVVCHGGPSTIVQARRAGKLPLVAPRRPELGEHVDGHQVRFAAWMAERGTVELVQTEAGLHELLDRVLADPSVARTGEQASNADAVSRTFGDLVDSLVFATPL